MFRTFQTQSANDVWTEIAAEAIASSDIPTRVSRAGRVYDLGNVCLSIANPRQRWVVSRNPAINPAFALAEVIWIMNGRDDSRFLNYFNNQLPCYAGDGEYYSGAYGHRLRSNLGFDQLERAYSALKNVEHSRQVVLQIWDARRDFPCVDGTPSSPDVPCNVISLLKVRDGHLDWTQVMRSNDLHLGLPHNLIQFTTLQEIIAGWLSLECGSFNLVTDSLHIYEQDLTKLQASSWIPAAENNDRFSDSRPDSESMFRMIANLVEVIIDERTTSNQLFELMMKIRVPSAYQNILCVLFAEGLRRRREVELAETVMSSCTNPSLIQAWDRWGVRINIYRKPAMSAAK